jgi:hypothetical protein
MRIEKRTMNWLPKETMWQQQKRINARNKAHTKRFVENQSVVAYSMFSAMDSARQGETKLTIQNAAQRVNATAAAKLGAMNKLV